MPELPEVESVCRQLAPLLTGACITDIEVILPRIVRLGSLEWMREARLISMSRFGKFIRIDTDLEHSIFVHLRMTGQLLWDPPVSLKDRFIRCIITTDKGSLFYRDIRTLGGFWICLPNQPPWKNLGIDPFEKNFNINYLLLHTQHRKLPIKSLLLDQSIIAGIGNIYASEILFEARINPCRRAGSLSSGEISRLHRSIIRLLQAAIDSQGTTFRDFRLSDAKEGDFQNFLKVYGRQGELCRLCNSLIVRIVHSGRSSYFCPKCQPPDAE